MAVAEEEAHNHRELFDSKGADGTFLEARLEINFLTRVQRRFGKNLRFLLSPRTLCMQIEMEIIQFQFIKAVTS